MKSDLKNPDYNLEVRTTKFSNLVIELYKSITQDVINKPIITQLIKSGTSVGANYAEANNACSKNDFKNKIYICKKEICETKYWLKIIKDNNLTENSIIQNTQREAEELTLIFGKILSSLRNNSKLKNS
ncbi:MAG: four helix bundle protein [Patescibacteria group bacterium]|nr:four helix bundle protein [Patescibacteria group bacterium]MDD4304640.1 four helix bundle protein [Patescibacteria group bacterium]MDD4695567.1 four helix bundle protein [Patescibacteria group bacterium]